MEIKSTAKMKEPEDYLIEAYGCKDLDDLKFSFAINDMSLAMIKDAMNTMLASEVEHAVEEMMLSKIFIKQAAEDYTSFEGEGNEQGINNQEYDSFIRGAIWFRDRMREGKL